MKLGASKQFFVPPTVDAPAQLSPTVRHEANRDDLKRICDVIGLDPSDGNLDLVHRILAASNFVSATRKS